jgi:hypothetical protein
VYETKDFSEKLSKENKSLVQHQLTLLRTIGVASHDSTIKNLIRFKPNKLSKIESEKYFNLALTMIRSSNSYLLKHIWKMDKNLGLKLSTRKLRRLMKEIIKDLDIGSNALNLKRK